MATGSRSPLQGEERALAELAAFGVALPWFGLLPRGDGHPVLVLPGYRGSDSSTVPLRSVLRGLGHDVSGWGLGVNRGPDRQVLRALRARLDELAASGRAVSLVGWSLGGVYARSLAREAPRHVRQVITLGSPFRRVESANGWPPPSAPATAVFSRSDPVVPWTDACETDRPRAESIEVRGTHVGLGHNPAVVVAVADRLSQAEGTWRPFEPGPAARHLFR